MIRKVHLRLMHKTKKWKIFEYNLTSLSFLCYIDMKNPWNQKMKLLTL